MAILPQSFYNRPVLEVARGLLGMVLLRLDGEVRLSGIITETEAYDGEADLACHARAGRTARTSVMYGPPGRAYVYFTYGMHWCLNAVTGSAGYPAAVLIRAIQPLEGMDVIAKRRVNQPPTAWCNGPAKLCKALNIDGRQNGVDLCEANSGLWIETGQPVPDGCVERTARIGIANVPEPWRSLPWRFVVHKIRAGHTTGR